MTIENADRPWSRLADIGVLAAWFGLAAGLVEALIFTVIRFVPAWITWTMREVNVSFDFLWLAPLVNVILFLAVAVVLMATVPLFAFITRLRAVTPQDAAVFVFAWLACYVALRVPDRLYRTAALVLSLGLAVRIWIWFHARPPARLTWFRRSLVGLMATVAVIAAVVRGGEAFIETRQTQSLAIAAADAPSVLLIVLDTLRADHLSAYGYGRPTTPNLDRIATEGVLFERAIAPSSWTLASHASLFTGRYVHEHHADSANPVLGTEYPTLAETLGTRGFATAGFSGNTFWATRNTGMARGFVHFEDYFRSSSDAVGRTVLGKEFVARIVRYFGQRDPLGRRRAGDITDAFLTWLDGSRRPFFAFVNYFDTHAPYTAPMPYHAQFMTERQRSMESGFAFRPPLVVADPLNTEEALYAAAYDGGISYLDSEIDRLFQALQKRGQLDGTLIVIVADHGEALSDHGFYDHGHSLYMDQVHVPLIVRWPGRIPAGVRVSFPVSTANVAATILDLEGLGNQALLPGDSLAKFWERLPPTSPSGSEPALSEVGHRDGVPRSWPIGTGWVRSLVSGDWHYIERQQGQVELYHLSDDPREQKNLSDTNEGRDVVSALHRQLVKLTAQSRPSSSLTRAEP